MIATHEVTERLFGDGVTANRSQRRAWSREAEGLVLGACLLDPAAVAACRDAHLSVDDFADRTHAAVYRAVLALDERGTTPDPLTVSQEMATAGVGTADENYTTCAGLQDGCGHAGSAAAHAAIVVEYSQRRRLQGTADALAHAALDPRVGIGEALDAAEQAIYAARPSSSGGIESVRSALPRVMQAIEAKAQAPDRLTGVGTPFGELNRLTFGWQPGQLIVVAARPSVGKTAFALQLAAHACRLGHRVLFDSFEMGTDELMERLLANEARVPLMAIRGGTLSDAQWPRLAAAVKTIAGWRFGIDDLAGASIGEVRSRARRANPADKTPIGLIVVDYLQLVTAKAEDRQNEVSAVSRGLKALAKELAVPVIALAQLNRAMELRGKDAEPQLSDLRDSGAIEQDADVVLFLHRPTKGQERDDGTALALLAKNRQGPLGRIPLQFRGSCAAFDSVASPGPLP